MSILSVIRDTDHALDALSNWLVTLGYPRESRVAIRTHVHREGTLEGVVPHWLDREHYEAATEVLCESFPPVGFYSPTWAEEPFAGYWTPNDTFRLEPPELEDDQADVIIGTDSMGQDIFLSDTLALPPIAGGAPDDDEPFEPTAEDWREWAEMQEQAEVRRYLARRGLDIDRRQISDDELAQLAAHGAI